MHTRLIEENMKNKILVSICITVISIIVIFSVLFFFLTTRFYGNTKINGIDCSFSTVEQARKRINEQAASNEIYIKFANGVQYTILGKDIDLCLNNKQELEKILNSRKLKGFLEEKEYTLENSFSFNEEKLENYLKSLPEFNEKSVSAKDAFINFNKENHTVDIIPETIGNVENVEDAFNTAKEILQDGKMILDFTVCPEIISTNEELINNKNTINNILKTTVYYKLRNGKTVTLDWENWIKEDKQGKWNIEINNNLKDFVDSLATEVSKMNTTCTFNATEIGNITLNLRKSLREQLDTTTETERIKKFLGTGQTYNVEPTYIESTYPKALSNYLEIDLTRQKVWLYRNGKCIVSGNCVSGSVSGGHSTPTGMFYLDNKTTKTYLKGRNNDGTKYNTFVNYWMPFNGGIGLHDATWRSRFGGSIYKNNGSHGCINLPYSVAKKIYENINYSTLIIIYKS